MNLTGLWAMNANIQLLTALILILILLVYIAFKLSEKKPQSSKTSR